jgi:DNA invertase Pin-like site-specific DNA recombinase
MKQVSYVLLRLHMRLFSGYTLYSEYPLLRVSRISPAYSRTPCLFTHCTPCRKKTLHRQRMVHRLNTRSPPCTPIHLVVLRKGTLHPMTLNASVRHLYALSAQKRSKFTMTQHNDQPKTLPVSPANGRAAIYARVAPGARTQTTQPQTAALVELANEQGFPNERIIVFEDAVCSGKRPVLQREAINALLAAITRPEQQEAAREPIEAIYASSEDRLFRDASAIDIAYFISACTERGVTLITPTFIYDFTQQSHVALFRFRCEMSYRYIAQQVRHMTGRTRQRGQHNKRAGE